MKASHPYHVLKAPVLSEESTIQMEAHNKYVFKVDPRANKQQIKEAVEHQWPDIRVVRVNTMNYPGKPKRRGALASPGRSPHWKKAVITLRPGDTIDLF